MFKRRNIQSIPTPSLFAGRKLKTRTWNNFAQSGISLESVELFEVIREGSEPEHDTLTQSASLESATLFAVVVESSGGETSEGNGGALGAIAAGNSLVSLNLQSTIYETPEAPAESIDAGHALESATLEQIISNGSAPDYDNISTQITLESVNYEAE